MWRYYSCQTQRAWYPYMGPLLSTGPVTAVVASGPGGDRLPLASRIADPRNLTSGRALLGPDHDPAYAGGGGNRSDGTLLVWRQWLIPLAPADQDVVGGGLEGEAESEQALEGGGGVVPAVEPEHELVEVTLEVLRPQAVVDAQRPPLRVREHAVDPGQHRVGRG